MSARRTKPLTTVPLEVARRLMRQKIYVPIEDVSNPVTCGLRQSHLKCGDDGDVDTGAGLGTPWIVMRWKKKWVRINVVDLLKAWVEMIDPVGAARIEASR